MIQIAGLLQIMDIKPNFKGNKSYLSSKPCQQCGRQMVWRKVWAKNWLQVKYCSDACRRSFKSIRNMDTDIEGRR